MSDTINVDLNSLDLENKIQGFWSAELRKSISISLHYRKYQYRGIYISQAPDIIYFSHDKIIYIPSIFCIILRKKSIRSGAWDTFLSHADVIQIIFF